MEWTDLCWEWVESFNAQKSMNDFEEMGTGGAYGSVVLFDQAKPRETVTLTAKAKWLGTVASTSATIQTPRGEMTFTLVDGSTVRGVITGVSRNRVVGEDLFEVSVNVRRTDV